MDCARVEIAPRSGRCRSRSLCRRMPWSARSNSPGIERAGRRGQTRAGLQAFQHCQRPAKPPQHGVRHVDPGLVAPFLEGGADHVAEAIAERAGGQLVPIKAARGAPKHLDHIDQPVISRIGRPVEAVCDGMEHEMLRAWRETWPAGERRRPCAREHLLGELRRADRPQGTPVKIEVRVTVLSQRQRDAMDDVQVALIDSSRFQEVGARKDIDHLDCAASRHEHVAIGHRAQPKIVIHRRCDRRAFQQQHRHAGAAQQVEQLSTVGDQVLIPHPMMAGGAFQARAQRRVPDL